MGSLSETRYHTLSCRYAQHWCIVQACICVCVSAQQASCCKGPIESPLFHTVNRGQGSYCVGRCSQDCSVLQINNGVYRSGFATMQGAYERAQADLYSALDAVERRLSQHRFLVGDRCAKTAPIMACSSLSCSSRRCTRNGTCECRKATGNGPFMQCPPVKAQLT